MSLWTEAKYPGDAVRIQMLHRDGELGDIRIQLYDGQAHVCAFLPGQCTMSPGDTPKTAPEKSEWATSSFAADELFDRYVREAYADGWQNYDRETYRG